MKIVQVIPSFNVGGGELLAVRLCAEIKRQQADYKLYLISLYDPIPSIVYDEALVSGATILSLGKKKGFDPLTPIKMIKALLSIKPDIIHTHLAGLRYALPAGALCKGSIKFHTVHNMASHETSRLTQRLHSFAFKQLGWYPVALSEKVQKSILNVYGEDAPVVNNGIGVKSELLRQKKEDLRRGCNIPDKHPIIITIGRLSAQKNHCLLIDAFQKLCMESMTCCLLIVGGDCSDGSHKKMLEDKVNNLPESIRNNIHFLGQRKDIPELLMASDVFVLSSDWEGVPLTLLEAMGYGIPVVSTSVGGIPDVIEDGVNGVLVPKGDVNDLSNAISEMLKNNSIASVLACNAQEKFRQCYSIENTARGYLELYKKI